MDQPDLTVSLQPPPKCHLPIHPRSPSGKLQGDPHPQHAPPQFWHETDALICLSSGTLCKRLWFCRSWDCEKAIVYWIRDLAFLITPSVGLEAPILWLPDVKNRFSGKDRRQEERVTTEDEMDGWHYWLDGHEFEQAPGVGDGQGSLACYSPWGCKQSDTTEQLNWYPSCSSMTKRNSYCSLKMGLHN